MPIEILPANNSPSLRSLGGSKMRIVAAQDSDVERAVDCLVDAFANDQQMAYFFPFERVKRQQTVREFFTILIESRLALGTPVMLASGDGDIQGAIMGYDTTRPEWLPQHTRRIIDFEAMHPGLSDRFALADEVMNEFQPNLPHYYLGVVGVSNRAQAKGIGRALISSFLSLSAIDTRSQGTFLDKANPQNVAYYERLGFEVMGSRQIGPTTTLWCLFKTK